MVLMMSVRQGLSAGPNCNPGLVPHSNVMLLLGIQAWNPTFGTLTN